MSSIQRRFCVSLVIVLGCLLGQLGFALWDMPSVPADRVAWSAAAQWIGTPEPSYRLYARYNFTLTNPEIESGWLRISADNNFILYVNGHQAGRQLTHLSSSLGFAARNTFANQSLNDSMNYEVKTTTLNVSYSKNWKHTFYADITPFLQPGKNVIAVEVMKAQPTPRLVVDGAVYAFQDAAPISLTTGVADWKVAILSENRQGVQWWEPDFPDLHWAKAPLLGTVTEATYSRFNAQLFERPFQAQWITGREGSSGELWFQGHWTIPKSSKRAFIRFSGNGEYTLLLNNQLVNQSLPDETRRPLLNLYDVSHLLKPGENVVLVRSARFLSAGQTFRQLGSLRFALDGWAEDEAGDLIAPIATDDSWQVFSQSPQSMQTEDSENSVSSSAIVMEVSNPQSFRRSFMGFADQQNYPTYLQHQVLWVLGGIGFVTLCAQALGRFWLERSALSSDGWEQFCQGSALLLPSASFLMGSSLLQHRYAEAERGLWFAQAHSQFLILLGFIASLLISLLWSRRQTLARWTDRGLWLLITMFLSAGIGIAGYATIALTSLGGMAIGAWVWHSTSFQLAIQRFVHQYFYERRSISWQFGKWLILISIIGIGFFLSIYELGFTPRDSDENTSLNAVEGILHTGAPIMPSGIWYTRSPVYHYLVAFWLKLTGDSYINARFISVLFAIATLILVFVFTRKVTGKFWMALVVTAILAIDPWQLMNARNLRFYQMLEFITVFSFWTFYCGFIEREGKRYQYLFLIGITVLLLTQEGVAPTLLPCFAIGLLCFYRSFSWRTDWQLIAGSIVSAGLYAYDVIFFKLKCLTPSVGISDSSSVPLGLHFSDVTKYAVSFFIGNSRVHTLYSLFFVLGLVYCLRQRDGRRLFLFSSIFIQLTSITLWVYTVETRYTYPIYPLFIMLSVYGFFCILREIKETFQSILGDRLPVQRFLYVCAILLILGNLELNRVIDSYADKLSRDNPIVFEYIQQHRQPGDIVIAGNPPAAGNVLGQLDYFLPPRLTLLFDGLYAHQGKVIDRWAGGTVISNLDQFNAVLANADRVWLQLDDNPRPEDLRQEQFYNYVRTLGEPVFETYGVRLRLWQRSTGILPRVPNQGKQLGAF
jgi:hypothetical protein